MSQTVLGLYKRYRRDGDYVWCIDKRVKRFGRLCESTGTADRDEAERYLLNRLRELREILVYGERPRRTFREAAAKYLTDFAYKKSIGRDAGWQSARRRAAGKYREWFGIECPEGFRNVRVHDLRHTFGRRLRAAGVGLEDRRDLMGHKAQDVTTHYSAAEIGNLVAAANRIVGSRKNPTPTLLRV